MVRASAKLDGAVVAAPHRSETSCSDAGWCRFEFGKAQLLFLISLGFPLTCLDLGADRVTLKVSAP